MIKRHHRRHRDQHTPDLFDHATYFPVETPRELESAQDFNAKLAQAMSQALDEARANGVDRYEVAKRMSLSLGVEVTKYMVDAYTSQSRDTHTISAVRLKAFVRATGCNWMWAVYHDGDGITVMEGPDAIHAQISLARTRRRALDEEIRALEAKAPLNVTTRVRR